MKKRKVKNPKELFTVSKTYDIVTPESTEEADFAESGFEFENDKMMLADVLREVERLGGYSMDSYENWVDLYGYDAERNMRDGSETTYALRIKGSPRAIKRLKMVLEGMKKKRRNPSSSGKIHVVRVSSEIYEDSYEEGEGEFTGAGFTDKVGHTFNSMADLVKYMSAHYGMSEKVSDYSTDMLDEDGRIETSRMVADHSDAQNGGWMEPTESEIKKWKRGDLMLYTESFTIYTLRASDLL